MFDARYIQALEAKIDALVLEVAALHSELSAQRRDLTAQRRSSTLPATTMQKIDELHALFKQLRP